MTDRTDMENRGGWSLIKTCSLLALLAVCALTLSLIWRVAQQAGDVATENAEVKSDAPARVPNVSVRRSTPISSLVPSGVSPATTTTDDRVEAPIASALDAIPDEAVFMFYDDTHLRAFLKGAEQEGVTVIDRIDSLHAVRVRTRDAAALRRVLARAPTPVARGPNLYVRRPDPPEPPEGVTYNSFGASVASWVGLGDRSMKWGEGVTVAVLDTAVVADVPLGALQTIDLVGGGAEPAAVAHGTAVASIIGGSEAVDGLAPGANLLAVRVMEDNGVGDTFTVAEGVMAAVERGARVINMSLGSGGDSVVLARAIAYAREQGAVIVAAAGNDGRDGILYPARYPGVVAVGAVDADGTQMYFSNRGEQLDLVAPGLGVAAAGGDGRPVLFSGTSAAAPVVAAAVAGIWSASPELTGGEVVSLLERYADEAGAPGPDPIYGKGILNAGRVLERDHPGIVDMALVKPFVQQNPVYQDELIVSLVGQNRGTEPLERVVLNAIVDGAPLELTFYDVGVGEIVAHDLRLTRASVGERSIVIDQTLAIPSHEDRSPINNRMRSTLEPVAN